MGSSCSRLCGQTWTNNFVVQEFLLKATWWMSVSWMGLNLTKVPKDEIVRLVR